MDCAAHGAIRRRMEQHERAKQQPSAVDGLVPGPQRQRERRRQPDEEPACCRRHRCRWTCYCCRQPWMVWNAACGAGGAGVDAVLAA